MNNENAAALIKQAVTSRDIAERIGEFPNAKGFICCPFHGERTPSLKFYDNGSFYCFGCHVGGDAIKFGEKLLGLNFNDTLHELDAMFGLNIYSHANERTAILAEAAKAEAERKKALAQEVQQEHERLQNVYLAATAAMALFMARKPASRPITSIKNMRLCEFAVS